VQAEACRYRKSDSNMAHTASASRTQSKLLRRHVTLLYAGFFLSGFSALIYQTAWQRMLGLFAGSDAVATTLVVGAFLFGLGVGSLWGGSFADRLSHRAALATFALCELGTAAFAVASRFAFYDVVFGRLNALADTPALVGIIVFACLLPPTILMGMSLPLLSKAVVYRIESAASEIGWLYGINTFGASCGALCAGFVLIGTIGYESTVYLAALLNLLVFGVALIVAFLLAEDGAKAAFPADARTADRTSGRIWLWSLIVFVSGFLIISLEIVWFRVLGILMQSNAYAFPLILSCFLVGDAAGIVYGARIAKTTASPLRLFQWLQGAVALYALASLTVLHLVVGFGLSHWLTDGRFAQADTWFAQLKFLCLYGFVSAACVMPPAFLLGMSFPITQKAVQDDPGLVGHRVGLIQLFNIFGNTCGAIVTGLVLLHWIGTSGTVRLIGLTGLVFLAALYWRMARSGERLSVQLLTAGALLVLVTLAFPANPAFWSRLHGGRPTETLVGEDRTGVVVMRHVAKADLNYGDRLESDADLMYVSGYAQSRVPFLLVHGALGMVGALIHPDPGSILMIGHGSGGSPYAAGVNSKTRHIRIIELVEPEYSIMEEFTSKSSYPALKRLLSDPRIERRVGDGRHFLYTNDERYDIIQADAIAPWSSHAGLLYSVEFFRQVKEHLAEGGMYVQWIPTKRTLAGILAVFPYVLQLNDVAIGSDRPIAYSQDLLVARLHSAEVRRYLEDANWNPDLILRRLTANPARMWGPHDPRADGDVNTDLFPKDEYFLNRRKLLYIDPSPRP
jgi:predicted membrane-bound spermidine synthase